MGWRRWAVATLLVGLMVAAAPGGEDWTQWKFDSRHSGDAAARRVGGPSGLVAAAALDDAVLTSPVVAGGKVYAVSASGRAYCLDAATLAPLWTFQSPGGPANCNNVSSPALLDGRLHFGTMAGRYEVLDAASGRLVREIDCGEPPFTTRSRS